MLGSAHRLKASAAIGLFAATPLTDFAPGQLYLGRFDGFLYDGSNTLTGQHDTDARNAAASVTRLDPQGRPAANGKIAVVAIGMSNWADEICDGLSGTGGPCVSGTFMAQARAAQIAGTVNPAIVFVNCAQPSQGTIDWATVGSTAWKNCLNLILPAAVITPSQVQVVLWKNGDIQPASSGFRSMSAMTSTSCQPTLKVDACLYEQQAANAIRLIASNFPLIKLMFLHSRIYGGYATTTENPEPYAYEYGFATKWLIEAQIDEMAGGGLDPIAGDLRATVAPILVWGPYFWASGATPRSDGLVWLRSDFQSDGTHPSPSGWTKVANMMMSFYGSSPYATPWFATTLRPRPIVQ